MLFAETPKSKMISPEKQKIHYIQTIAYNVSCFFYHLDFIGAEFFSIAGIHVPFTSGINGDGKNIYLTDLPSGLSPRPELADKSLAEGPKGRRLRL